MIVEQSCVSITLSLRAPLWRSTFLVTVRESKARSQHQDTKCRHRIWKRVRALCSCMMVWFLLRFTTDSSTSVQRRTASTCISKMQRMKLQHLVCFWGQKDSTSPWFVGELYETSAVFKRVAQQAWRAFVNLPSNCFNWCQHFCSVFGWDFVLNYSKTTSDDAGFWWILRLQVFQSLQRQAVVTVLLRGLLENWWISTVNTSIVRICLVDSVTTKSYVVFSGFWFEDQWLRELYMCSIYMHVLSLFESESHSLSYSYCGRYG